MATEITADKEGDLHLFNSLGNAPVGRWCKPPLVPDRCYCRDAETMLNLPAAGYAADEVYRVGACYGCYKKYLPWGVWSGLARSLVLEIPV